MAHLKIASKSNIQFHQFICQFFFLKKGPVWLSLSFVWHLLLWCSREIFISNLMTIKTQALLLSLLLLLRQRKNLESLITVLLQASSMFKQIFFLSSPGRLSHYYRICVCVWDPIDHRCWSSGCYKRSCSSRVYCVCLLHDRRVHNNGFKPMRGSSRSTETGGLGKINRSAARQAGRQSWWWYVVLIG